jgi:hypothetical protein
MCERRGATVVIDRPTLRPETKLRSSCESLSEIGVVTHRIDRTNRPKTNPIQRVEMVMIMLPTRLIAPVNQIVPNIPYRPMIFDATSDPNSPPTVRTAVMIEYRVDVISRQAGKVDRPEASLWQVNEG